MTAPSSRGWGVAQWSKSPWGGPNAPFTVVGARAFATRTVRVTLSLAPLATSAVVQGDALNPATWAVTRTDTGAAFQVLGATQASAHDVDVLLLAPLASFAVQHKVQANGLRAANGSAIIADPISATFAGLTAASDYTPGQPDYDVANPPTPVLSQGIGGTLLVVGGDYATEQGPALARKMAFRDLFTPTGSFKHLPSYGFGLGERVKQGLRASEIPALRGSIERLWLSRPWVQSASAPISFDEANGILSLAGLLVLKKQQNPVKLPLRVDSAGAVIF